MGNKNKKEKHRDISNKKSKHFVNSFDSQNDKEEKKYLGTETEKFEENADEKNSSKRGYEDDDLETEEQPRRKKKKKAPVETETPGKKGKKSIRQMKREKFAERQAEAVTLSKNQLKTQCLSYLSQWKHDRQNWKFMKVKQLWLFKNKFTSDLVPDASWPTLLEYFNSAKGNIRNMLLEDSNKVIKNMDDWIEKQKENSSDNNEDEILKNEKPDEISYKRARDLIQCLEE